eukprot:6077058-Pleurochrysis_carterae.AAC.1
MTEQIQRLLSPSPPKGGFLLWGIDYSEATAPAREAASKYMWQRSYADVFLEILESNPDLAVLLIGRTTNSYTGRCRA